MCSWGHPPWLRVTKGENQSQWSDFPAVWASRGKARRTGDWGHRRSSLGRTRSGACYSARLHPGTVHEGDQIDRRRDRDDLVLGTDPNRARRSAVFGIGQPDHRCTRQARRWSLRDHGHVESLPIGPFGARVDNRDVTTVAIQQPAEGRREQPRPHCDEHLEGWLR